MSRDHIPVLLEQAIAALAIKPNGLYVDATFGRGGHSQVILEHLDQKGRLFAIDKDPDSIAFAKEHFANEPRFQIFHNSFADLKSIAKKNNFLGKVDGVLLDLGVSSPQLDSAERGFSFLKDGPLDMRMDPSRGMSASDWIARAKEEELVRVFQEYGEEKFSRRMARAIVVKRQQAPIVRTKQLADIVSEANPKWEKHKHPATRVFQAIRILVNQELQDLHRLLTDVLDVLNVGGRLVVISFHSLEDRIVKRFMRTQTGQADLPARLPIKDAQIQRKLRVVTKAIKASENDIIENPRARSAVLRTGEKLS